MSDIMYNPYSSYSKVSLCNGNILRVQETCQQTKLLTKVSITNMKNILRNSFYLNSMNVICILYTFLFFFFFYTHWRFKSERFAREEFRWQRFLRGKSEWQKGWGGRDEVGKKIRHKINSIQLAECSLLLTGNISRRSLPRREQRERGFVLEGGV